MKEDSRFRKSQIYTCGKDKTSYILKSGLAPPLKNELISAVVNNAGQFVSSYGPSYSRESLLCEQGSIDLQQIVEAQTLVCDQVVGGSQRD